MHVIAFLFIVFPWRVLVHSSLSSHRCKTVAQFPCWVHAVQIFIVRLPWGLGCSCARQWDMTYFAPTFCNKQLAEGSLEVKLPTIGRDEKPERRRYRCARVRRKSVHTRETLGKSRIAVFFQWFVVPEGRKVGSLKRRVRSHVARGEMKNCTPLWREAQFQVKITNTHHARKLGCGKMARRCGTKHISKSKCTKHTMVEWLDHFLKFTRRKIARRCGERHICKSKS